MPLDYSILQQQPPAVPPNTLGSLGRIEAIGALMQRDRDIKAEQEANALLQQMSQQYADRPDEMVSELRRRGFVKQAQHLETYLIDYKKKVFDARKAELDGDLVAGRISAEAAEAERKAMDAASPDKMLPLFAAAKTLEEWESAKALTTLKFGAKADPFLAQVGTFNPSTAAFAGRAAMGPEAVTRLDAQAAATASDDARLDKSLAETIRHNQAQEQGVIRGQDVGATTSRRGQDLADARAKAAQAALASGGDASGVKLSAANIEKVAAVDQSIGMLDDIETLLPNMAGNIGLVDGRVAKAKLATGAKVTPELAAFDAQLTGLKNAVIKATTGAAMSEPEAKRIMGQLPDLSQPETVFKARLATTRKNLELLKRRTIELSGGTVAPAATGGKVRVTGKDGQTYEFPSASAAEAFRKAGG